MARPDLTEIRTAQILDSAEHCIARFGLEGATLEAIAERAGVKRNTIRHYIGNRDELLLALTRRLTARSLELLNQVVRALPQRRRSKTLIDYLFMSDPARSTTAGDTAAADSSATLDLLIAMSEQHPECRLLLRSFIEQLVDTVSTQLLMAHPKAGAKRCWTVANGVLAIVFVAESLQPLGLPRRHNKSWKQNAMALLGSLDGPAA